MSCDGIVYPFIEQSTGLRKWRGLGGDSADSACASIFVHSNIVDLPVEVSHIDDDELQDGVTDFCRRYGEQTPITVTLFPPLEVPDAGGGVYEFYRWILDGVFQEVGHLALDVEIDGSECHDAKATYGNPISVCGGNEVFTDVITLSTSSNINVSDGPECGNQWCPCFPSLVDSVPALLGSAPHSLNLNTVGSGPFGAAWGNPEGPRCGCPNNDNFYEICPQNFGCAPVWGALGRCDPGGSGCFSNHKMVGLRDVIGFVSLTCNCAGGLARMTVAMQYGVDGCYYESIFTSGICDTMCPSPTGYAPGCPAIVCCHCKPGPWWPSRQPGIGFAGTIVAKNLPHDGTQEDCDNKMRQLRDQAWEVSGFYDTSNSQKIVTGNWSISVKF